MISKSKVLKNDCELIKLRIEKDLKEYNFRLNDPILKESYTQSSIIERSRLGAKIEALNEIKRYLQVVKGENHNS